MANARVSRGRATQQLIAEYWRPHWPECYALPGAVGGRDVHGMPGLAPEIKATTAMPILAALRQARNNAGCDLPFVVWRPNGYGGVKIDQWVMAFTVADGTGLLVRAGYGQA